MQNPKLMLHLRFTTARITAGVPQENLQSPRGQQAMSTAPCCPWWPQQHRHAAAVASITGRGAHAAATRAGDCAARRPGAHQSHKLPFCPVTSPLPKRVPRARVRVLRVSLIPKPPQGCMCPGQQRGMLRRSGRCRGRLGLQAGQHRGQAAAALGPAGLAAGLPPDQRLRRRQRCLQRLQSTCLGLEFDYLHINLTCMGLLPGFRQTSGSAGGSAAFSACKACVWSGLLTPHVLRALLRSEQACMPGQSACKPAQCMRWQCPHTKACPS